MERTQPKDVWAAGELYELYIGRWSQLVAREMLRWLSIPGGKEWLDVGCGTSALSRVILEDCSPKSVKGIDSSPEFIAYARRRLEDARNTFEMADAEELPAESGSFWVAISGLMLNFLTKPERALAEMRRVVRPGGVVAAYVWDYADKMELIRIFWDAALVLDPAAAEFAEGNRFSICQPAPLGELFSKAGLCEVEVRAIDIDTRFSDFNDYWLPFLGGQGPAPGFAMSLNEKRRTALRERVRSTLPIAEDGSIDLMARAWAVRGRVP